MKNLILFGAVLFAASSAFAGGAHYVCKMGEAKREIKVHYVNEGAKVPCEVHYIKGADAPETKWSANAEEGYCEDKAKAFSEKLGTLGYSCEESGASGAAGSAAEKPAEKAH